MQGQQAAPTAQQELPSLTRLYILGLINKSDRRGGTQRTRKLMTESGKLCNYGMLNTNTGQTLMSLSP